MAARLALALLVAAAGAWLAAPALAEEGRSADVREQGKRSPGPEVSGPSHYLRGRLKRPAEVPVGPNAPRTAPGPRLGRPGVVHVRRGVASQGTFEPSDSTGSAGPGAYVEFTNERVAVVRKSDLRIVRTRDFDSFLGSPGGDVADPQIQWDEQGRRWLYAALRTKGETNYLEYGWSQTPDPGNLREGWCRFTVRTGDEEPDYPKLGHSDRYLVVGANLFRDERFRSSALYVVRKPAPGVRSCRGGRVAVFGTPGKPLTTADGDLAFTPEPVNLTESSAQAYVVAADDPLASKRGIGRQLMVWRIAPRAGRPALVEVGNVAVPRYRIPPDVPQRGVTSKLDSASFSAALTQAVGRGDPTAGGRLAIWTQHTVRAGERSVVRWYELVPGERRPLQTGTIRAKGRMAFNGAIAPALDGTGAVIVYNTGSAGTLPDLRVRRRDARMQRGKMGDERVVARSRGARSGCSSPCPWGDYAGASPDPRAPGLVWASSQIDGRPRSENAPQWVTINVVVATGSATANAGLGLRSR